MSFRKNHRPEREGGRSDPTVGTMTYIAGREPIRSLLLPVRLFLSRAIFESRPVRLRGGKLRLYLNPSDTSAVIAFALDLFERYELDVVRRIVQVGDTILDAGANIGYYSLKLSEMCGPSGSVFAFEPDPENFKVLSLNVETNKASNVRLFNCALSDFDGTARLFRSATNAGDYSLFPRVGPTKPPVDVACRRIDSITDLITRSPRLIKIDVQGLEAAVLRGATNSFKKWNPRPVILLEFEPDTLRSAGEAPETLLEMLGEMHYEVARIVSKRLCPLAMEERSRYTRWAKEGCNILAIPRESVSMIESLVNRPAHV